MLPGRYQDSVAVIGEGSQERGSQVSVIGGRNGNEKEESFLPLPPFEQREGWGNLPEWEWGGTSESRPSHTTKSVLCGAPGEKTVCKDEAGALLISGVQKHTRLASGIVGHG